MKTELIQQYGHTWRIFEGIVKDFDPHSWIQTGRGATTPARTAFHILKGVKYYIEDPSTITFASGKPFEADWETVGEGELSLQDDILICMDELKLKTEKWLSEIDVHAENNAFPWVGKIKLGIVLFLLRHNLYHLGELSSLLNERKKMGKQQTTGSKHSDLK